MPREWRQLLTTAGITEDEQVERPDAVIDVLHLYYEMNGVTSNEGSGSMESFSALSTDSGEPGVAPLEDVSACQLPKFSPSPQHRRRSDGSWMGGTTIKAGGGQHGHVAGTRF